tara:strand:- start:1760 stop:2194 length:435 start_codon:yes stop_codon:yes gene_type:complete
MKIKDKLYCNDKIEFKYVPEFFKHKVIAIDKIKKGEVIEEAPVMLDSTNQRSFLHKTFKWPKGSENPICNVFVHGFGSFFEKSADKYNVDWECDFDHNIIIFKSVKDIEPNDIIILHEPLLEKSNTIDVKNNIRKFLNDMKGSK